MTQVSFFRRFDVFAGSFRPGKCFQASTMIKLCGGGGVYVVVVVVVVVPDVA